MYVSFYLLLIKKNSLVKYFQLIVSFQKCLTYLFSALFLQKINVYVLTLLKTSYFTKKQLIKTKI